MAEGFGNAVKWMTIIVGAAGFALALILFWVVPWLWSLAKPVFHSITG